MQTKVVLGVVAAAAITAGAFWISGPSTSADAPDPPLQAAAAPPDPAPVPAARTAQPEVPGAGTTTAEDSTTAVSLPGAGLLVHGTTLDPDGRPLEDVEVLVFDTSQDSMAAPLLASQRTTKDGAFRFDTLPFAGTSPRARLVCLHADRATTGLDFDPTLEIPLRVTLGGATTLEGSVVDAEGRAIAHARVLLSSVAAAQGSLTIPDPLQERLRAVTEDNGRFALPGLPRGQQVLLQVVADGYSSLTDQRALSPDSRSGPVEYVLLPEAVISGTVRYENGTPAAGLRVGCQTQDHFYSSSSSWGMAVTGEDGSYRVSGLGAGPWNVFVTLSDALQEEWAVAAHEGVALAEGQVRDGVDFTLTRGTLLVFRLIDASTKAPVPDVRVACYDSSRPRSGAAVHGATTGEDGTARMRVPAGPVYAYVMGLADGYLTPDGVREFEASDGETRELLFALQPATTVEGVVVDGEGTAIPGAWVYRMGTGRTLSPPGVRSAADGSFRLSGFVPGNPLMLRAETEALGMPRPLVLAADSEESRPVRLVLQPRPVERVRGRVLDLAALPASGAQVNLREMGPGGKPLELNPASPTFTTTADTDGRFSFSVWPGQEYRISAGALADREHDDYSILIGETETFLVEPLTDVELPDLLLRKLP